MKRICLVLVIAIVLGITLLGYSQTAPGLAQSRPAVPATHNSARVVAALRSAPVMFIENAGQFAEGARFQVRGGDRTIWLSGDAIWVTVLEQTNPSPQPLPEAERGAPPSLRGKGAGGLGRQGVNLKLTFPGANPHTHLEPFNRLDTHVSYFIGNDPDKWRPDAPVWGGVRYVDLYPGIDLEFTSENGRLVQRLVAQLDADLSAVLLRVEGADSLTLEGDRLRLTTAVGDFTLPLLQAVSADGSPLPLEGKGPEVQANEVTAPFTSASPLPSPSAQTAGASDLLYATFLGGSGYDYGYGIAVDGSGAVYVTGCTFSSDFPTTPGAFDTSHNGGYDAFVVKLNASGSALAYATFLGGSDYDYGYGIAVDGSGAAYVTGWTASSDFPTTPGAFDTTYNGANDAFIVKLNAAGSALVYATFLGGSSSDGGFGIAVDGSGAAYVTGYTYPPDFPTPDFPTTPGAFDTTYNGAHDAFIVKLNAAGSALAYATFLGGSAYDYCYGIAVDGSGAAYVTGYTYSSDFPTTPGAFDTTCNAGDYDALVVKLNAAGSALAYATFLGGSSRDWGLGIAVDGSGAAYVTGFTWSSDFPTTPGAFDTTYNGDSEALVVKLNAAGSALAYATFLGGSSRDLGYGIAVDSSGAAYVTGQTWSSDFPTTPGAFDMTYNGDWDAFVVKLNATGSALAYATFLGGSSGDVGYGIAVDGCGAAYVKGWTASSDFPTTPGAFDTTYNGDWDAFVAKLALGGYGPPAPFLDLPFDYGGSVSAFVQALQDNDDGGRVSSWFDHAYPDGFKNQLLVLYDSRARTKNLYNPNLGCYEGRCYDGHNGFDFTYVDPQPEVPGSQDLPIRPAAAGKVVVAQPDSGSDYGNYVIVDHQNRYFTLYAHLKAISVSQGQTVTTNDTLGIMGSTGRSFGTHLHFGVYRDNGNGQWDGEGVDKPVDPYGWKGDGTDPWVSDRQGPTSSYIWIHQISTQDPVSGDQGATMTDATGHIQATIPPGAFSGQATLELSPGPVAGSSAQLRSSGRSFWLRLLEWLLGGGGLQSATALQSTTQFTLTKPITLTITYTDTDVLHLDVTQLVLYRWDEEQETWQPMTTTVDLANHVVTAQTQDLGDFDLQAPLFCATDDLEPDDGYAAARWVWPNDWPLARGLDIPQDSDWARFDAVQEARYTVRTQNLAGGADTVLNLYDVDALTLLASNDNIGGGPASELVWTAPYTGTFFIETVSAPGGTMGCSATYELTIATIPGDVIADCQVNIADIMAVASRWRLSAANPDPDNDPNTPNYETRFDLDGDGDIDIVDIMKVAAHWGETCGGTVASMSPSPDRAKASTQNPTVSLVPADSTVTVGSTFTVTVTIDEAVDLGAFQFDLYYPPSSVQVEAVTLGGFLASTGRTAASAGPKIDNATGLASFAGFSFGTPAGPNGSGALALVRLRAAGAGNSSLDLQNVQVLDTQVNPEVPIIEDGSVTVIERAERKIYLPLVLKGYYGQP